MECSYKNRSHSKNISKEKNCRHILAVYVLIYPLSKFEGHWTNSLWVLAFFSVRFKWKNWFEKTALTMLIRRVIFTSGQNLKPPFLCQYLIRSMISFFALEISFGSLLFNQKKWNLKKIVDLKVYCNLKNETHALWDPSVFHQADPFNGSLHS